MLKQSVLGLVDIYNLLPAFAVDVKNVHEFQEMLQGMLTQLADKSEHGWENLFCTRRPLYCHRLREGGMTKKRPQWFSERLLFLWAGLVAETMANIWVFCFYHAKGSTWVFWTPPFLRLGSSQMPGFSNASYVPFCFVSLRSCLLRPSWWFSLGSRCHAFFCFFL